MFNKPEQYHIRPDMAVTIDPDLEGCVKAIAATNGLETATVWRASEDAIRTRHNEAYFKYIADLAHGRQPDIFRLDVGPFTVIYTVEVHDVVVRGYQWLELAHPLGPSTESFVIRPPEWNIAVDELELN